MIMDSNISRDHIALVAMEKLLERYLNRKPTIWVKIGAALGICKQNINLPLNVIVDGAYRIADAMIAEREAREKEERP